MKDAWRVFALACLLVLGLGSLAYHDALAEAIAQIGSGGIEVHTKEHGNQGGIAVGGDEVAAASAPILAVSFQEPTQSPGDCTGDAKLHLDMDEASGNLANNCGDLETFTANGAPTYSGAAPSGLGTAVTFGGPGSGDYFSKTDDDDFDPGTSDFVVEFWARSTNTSVNEPMIASKLQTAAAAFPGWAVYFSSFTNDSEIKIWLSDGTNQSAQTCENFQANDGSWHYYRIVFDRSANVEYFVDGVSQCTDAISTVSGSLSNARDIRVGDWEGAASREWDGQIADVRLCIGSTTCDSGYVDGLDPETGTATPTFVRATGAVTLDSTTGLAQFRPAGVPSVGAPFTGGPTALTMRSTGSHWGLDGHDDMILRANYSYALDNVAWTTSNVTITADNGLDLFGLTRADEVDDADGVNAGYIEQTLTGTSSAGWGMQAFVCYSHATSTPTPELSIDTTTCTCATASTTIQCCFCEDTSSSTADPVLRFYPAGTTGSNTGKVDVFALQSVQGNTRSGSVTNLLYVVEGSDVTINEMDLNYGTVTGAADPDVGSASYWYVKHGNQAQQLFAWGADSPYVAQADVVGDHRLVTVGLADNANLSGADTPNIDTDGDWHNVCSRWDQPTSAMQIVQDGVAGTEVTADTWTAGGSNTTLYVGNANGSSAMGAVTAGFEFYNFDLGEQGCIDNHTAESGDFP